MNASTSSVMIRNLRTMIAFAMVAGATMAASQILAADSGAKTDLWLSSETKGQALVIGNSRYRHISPLANPANDATDISTALMRLGFEVTLAVDATHKAMEDEILKFGRNLRKGGVGLFYFAGHGVQVSGRNYLIPIDANVDSESDIKFEAVDAGRVLGKMEDAGNGINIIILDACRNNPFASTFRSGDRGLAKMEAPTGSILAYSTAPGSVAADGEGRNGLYTAKLLKFINQDGLSIEDCFKKVRIEVMQASEKRQIPWESSSLTANFYFVSPQPVRVATKDSRPSESVELLFWESVKDSQDVKQYQLYIDAFPNGAFITLAKIYIEKYGIKEASVVEKKIEPREKNQPTEKLAPTHEKNKIGNVKKTVEANQKLKLAFLPSLFQNLQSVTIKHQYESVLNGIEKQGNVSLVYSYRDDPDADKSKIWKKTNLFSTSEVDAAAVVRYCSGLGADIALIMRSTGNVNHIPIELYLVDLKVGKISYQQKSYPNSYTLLEEIEALVIKSVKTFTDS